MSKLRMRLESHLEAPDAIGKVIASRPTQNHDQHKKRCYVLACISRSLDAEADAMRVPLIRIVIHVLGSSVLRFHLGQNIVLNPYPQSALLLQFLAPCKATSEGERQWHHRRPAQKAASASTTMVAGGHPQKERPQQPSFLWESRSPDVLNASPVGAALSSHEVKPL